MTRPLRLQVLGPLRVWREGLELNTGPRQQRCLLALLLIREGRPISLAELVDQVWGTGPPASAVNVVHKYVGALRRLLEPGLPRRSAGAYLLRHGTGYRFDTDLATLDLAVFHRFAGAARGEAAATRPDEALDRYLDALRLCHGPAGEALADSSAAVAAFATVDSEFFDSAVAAAGIAVHTGRAAEVLGPLRTAARMGRFHEPVHASLIAALAAAGQQAEALACYRAIRDRLAAELGIDPGRELRDAERLLLTRPSTPSAGEPPQNGNRAVVRQAPHARPEQLPPDLPRFVGRTVELKVLRDLVTGMRDGEHIGPMVIAVDGVDGVGKSALVTHFALTVAAEFPDGQLHLDLQGHRGEQGSVPAGDALRSLLRGLGGRSSDPPPDTFDALVGTYRGRTAGMRILVLLHNVRDPSQIRPLLPNSPDSLVLVTSRHPLAGLTASGGVCLFPIEAPEPSEAGELLLEGLTATFDRADEQTVTAIVEACGRLPLALAVVTARLGTRPQLSLAEVATGLRDGACRTDGDPRTTLCWTYHQLSSGAARLFRLLSVAPSAGATVDACVSLSGRDPGDTRAELTELTEAALIVVGAHGRYTYHVLVKAFAAELFEATESKEERHLAISRLLQHYLHSSTAAAAVLEPHRDLIALAAPLTGVVAERPAALAEALSWFAANRDVLREAVRLATEIGYGIVPWHLVVAVQRQLEWYGYVRDWEDVMRVALCAARERDDVIGEAHMLRQLAGARWASRAGQEAVDLLGVAHDLFAENGMTAEQATVHENLHEVHHRLGLDEPALADAERAVALGHAAGDLRVEGRSLARAGRSLTRLGRHEEADRMLRQALEAGIREEDAGVRVALARNLAAMGRADEARTELDRAVESAREMSQGLPRFETYRSLAEAFRSIGSADSAEPAPAQVHEALASFPDGWPDRLPAETAAVPG